MIGLRMAIAAKRQAGSSVLWTGLRLHATFGVASIPPPKRARAIAELKRLGIQAIMLTGDNRGVEFDQFPSELLGSVVVYKTPDAALLGQGLAGSVDLRTVRPLAYGRQAIALNYRHEWNDIGALNSGTTDSGDRYTVSYIDQFMDGTLGVALGYAHMSSPYQSERFNAWGYPTYSDGNLLTGGVKPYVMSSELERDGYMGVLEWRPNDRIHSTIDAFYSEFKNTQVLRGIEFPLAWGGSSGDCTVNVASPVCRPAPSLRPGYTVEDGLIVAGTWDNIKGVVRNANTFEPFDPAEVGGTRKIVIGKHSGTEAIRYVLREQGIEADAGELRQCLGAVREFAMEEERALSAGELVAIHRRIASEAAVA